MPTKHLYNSYTSGSNTLHVLKTTPDNIKLTNYGGSGTLDTRGDIGVNGGFFSDKPLSIAISDGTVLCNDNHWLGGGIIGYNGSSIVCMSSVQSASAVSSCTGSGKWAQGGFSMWLGDSNWLAKMKAETDMPDHYNVARQRTVLVGDTTNNAIFLMMTTGNYTFEGIRNLTKAYLGSIGYTISDTSGGTSRFKGLILDGGGSSQIRCKKANNSIIFEAASSRNLYQCIVLRDQN